MRRISRIKVPSPTPRLIKEPPMQTPVKNTSRDKKAATEAAAQALNGLVGLADELAEVMDREIVLVETRKSAEHSQLLKRKQRLAGDYRAGMKCLAQQPDLLRQLPEELRI